MQSLGSGFVIHPAGYIVTNEHVVDRATEVKVVLADGQSLAAQVLATDDEHDLAVLKVTPRADKPLKAITLGASEDLMIGEPVYAIGNPFGYAGSMTRGIVSAVNRELELAPGKVYKNLVQTDASINPGNSGGPLLNSYGQVIGINSAIRGDAHGIGFAISVSRLRDLLPEFLNTEVLHRAVIGFSLEELRQLSPPATVRASVRVKAVQPDSAAAKAGLLAGDELWTVQGQDVHDIVETLVALAQVKVGDTLTLRIGRAGKATDLKLAVTQSLPPESERVVLARLGLAGKDVTAALATQEKLSVSTGVLITQVEKGGPAAKAGLQLGDVVYQLGPYYVTSLDDVANLLKSAKANLDVRIGVVRGDSRGRAVITVR
jgi:serine protease Do